MFQTFKARALIVWLKYVHSMQIFYVHCEINMNKYDWNRSKLMRVVDQWCNFWIHGEILHKSMINHVLTFEDMTLEKLELLESSSWCSRFKNQYIFLRHRKCYTICGIWVMRTWKQCPIPHFNVRYYSINVEWLIPIYH